VKNSIEQQISALLYPFTDHKGYHEPPNRCERHPHPRIAIGFIIAPSKRQMMWFSMQQAPKFVQMVYVGPSRLSHIWSTHVFRTPPPELVSGHGYCHSWLGVLARMRADNTSNADSDERATPRSISHSSRKERYSSRMQQLTEASQAHYGS
jgi:hypothetical protein